MEAQAYEVLNQMIKNWIITQPDMIYELFKLFPDLQQSAQINITKQLLGICRAVLHNPAILMSAQLQERDPIEQLFAIYVSANQAVKPYLLEFIGYLMQNVLVKRRYIGKIYQILQQAQDFSLIEGCLQLLSQIFESVQSSQQLNYFYFSGNRQGISIDTRNNPSYPFAKGIAVCLWLRLEELNSLSTSFIITMHSKGNGGIEIFIKSKQLYLRTLAPEYIEVQDNDGIQLTEIPTEEWIYLGLEFEAKGRGQSTIKVVINNEEPQNFAIPSQPIRNPNAILTKGEICSNFTGQMSTVLIFNNGISIQKIKSLYQQFSHGPQSTSHLKLLHKIIDKSLSQKLIMLYTHQRVSNKKVFEAVNRLDANINGDCQGCTLYCSRIDDQMVYNLQQTYYMSHLGGICSLLPIVNVIAKASQNKAQLLEKWLEILQFILINRPENQLEATSMKFFKAFAEVLSNFPADCLSVNAVQILQQIHSRVIPQLADQISVHLLWSLEIWSKSDKSVQLKLLSTLQQIYSKNPKILSKAVGVNKIIDLILENYQDDQEQIQSLVSIIQTIFLAGKELTNMSSLMQVLSSDCSPFLIKELLTLFKQLFSDRSGDLVSAHPSVFAQYFIQHKGIELLLYLIGNEDGQIKQLTLQIVALIQKHQTLTDQTDFDIYQYIGKMIFTQKDDRFTPKSTFSKSNQSSSNLDFLAQSSPRLNLDQLNFNQSDTFSDQNPESFIPPPPPKRKTFNLSLDDKPEPPKSKFAFQLDSSDDNSPPAAPPSIGRGINFNAFDDDDDTDSAFKPPPPPKAIAKKTFDFNIPAKKKTTFDFENNERSDEFPAGKFGLRTKKSGGSLTFDFNFGQDTPFLDEEEDVIETPQSRIKKIRTFSQSRGQFQKKIGLSAALEIDTDEINKNYTYGGEKGKIMQNESEDEILISEIRQLAGTCIQYMKGELQQQDTFSNFQVKPAVQRPQTVRGLKQIDFSASFKKNIAQQIEEASIEYSEEETDGVKSTRRGKVAPAYKILLKILLDKESDDGLDDSDMIQSQLSLNLFLKSISWADLGTKVKALQDLVLLTKWSSYNANIMLNNDIWHSWILEMLLKRDNDDGILEYGTLLHTQVLKQAILMDDNGSKYIQLMLDWIQTQTLFESSREIVTQLLINLLEALKSNSMGCRANLTSTIWRNLITILFYIDYLLYCNSKGIKDIKDYTECTMLYKQGGVWNDGMLITTYFQILESIWPNEIVDWRELETFTKYKNNFIEPSSDQMINNCIANALKQNFKCDIQLIIFEPIGNLKQRGNFIQTAILLACAALLQSEARQDFNWYGDIVDKIFRFLLIISETDKRQFDKATSKILCDSILLIFYIVGRSCHDTLNVQKQSFLRDLLGNILRCIFQLYIKNLQGSFGKAQSSQKMHIYTPIVFEAVQEIINCSQGMLTQEDITLLYNSGFSNMEGMLQPENISIILANLEQKVYSIIVNEAKFQSINNSKKNSLVQDASIQVDEIQENVLKVIEQKQEQENYRQQNSKAHLDERLRQRNHMWQRLQKMLSEWKGIWNCGKDYQVEMVNVLDKQLSRPLLKIKSLNSGFYADFKQKDWIIDNLQNELRKQIQVKSQRSFGSDHQEHKNEFNVLGDQTETRVIEISSAQILPLTSKFGKFQIVMAKRNKKIRFVLDESCRSAFNSETHLFDYKLYTQKPQVKEWQIDQLFQIHPKMYNGFNTALEFLFIDGRIILFNFSSEQTRQKVLSNILSISQKVKLPSSFQFKNNAHQFLLVDNELTSKWLNWEISNFEYLMHLNFQSSRSYNDICQYPILPLIINQNSTLDNINSYRDLQQTLDSQDRYFSNMPGVLFQLKNLHPFNKVNSRFCGLCENIPESYTDPNIIKESDLPAWAHSPYDYIRILKEILESDNISYSLHNWIDIIFGCRQTQQEKIDASRNPELYMNIGCQPLQLFNIPHPQRFPKEVSPRNPTILSQNALIKIYLPVSRRHIECPTHFKNYLELPEQAIIKAKFIKDRIFALRNNGTLVTYRWWSTPIGQQRTPFTCAIEREKKIVKDHKSGTIEMKDRSIYGFNSPVQILSNGRIIAEGGYWDGRLTVQKSHDKESPVHLWNHYNTITCIDIDNEEKLAVTGCKDGDILVWNVDGDYWQARWHYSQHEKEVTSICISTDLNIFVTVSLDGTCNIYSLRKGRLLRSINIPNKAAGLNIVCSSASPAKIIVFTEPNKTIYSFALNGNIIAQTNEKHSSMISPIIQKSYNFQDFLIYGTEGGDIVIRNAGTLQQINRFTLGGILPILTIIMSPDQRYLLVGGSDRELTVLTDPTVSVSN